MSPRVALVSSERGLRLDPDLPIAAPALRQAGLAVDVVRWDDAAVDWADHDLAVVRSCWDYSWRLPEFLGWAASVPRLRNAVELLRWNTDKTHLRDLARAGLPVVPTVWDPTEAGQLPDAPEWVVKPSVSAGSRDTARWDDPAAALAHVAELTAAGRTAMLQPYLAGVDTAGETAMLFLGGRFSHAVRKGPLLRRGEGVRQDRNSRGDLRAVEPTAAQRELAEAALDAVPALVPGAAPPLYARIDLVPGPAGRPVLLELELAEPSLFLPQAPAGAVARLVRSVEDAIAA
ncbi:RimK family alpha-L-glutamate ligase [Modestobacter sp. I12A-02662]|uniref:ATP-grasp domain-containing protein n=1 Tax=Modestobacter sp. I12A-02662 TaxID=1730496 RepID=UPI0034DF7BCC